MGVGVKTFGILEKTAPLSGPGWGTCNHFLAFAVLMTLGCSSHPVTIAALIAGLILYGGAIAILQSFTSYRHAEWSNLIAEGIGIFAG